MKREPAYKLDFKVDPEIIEARFDELHEAQRDVVRENDHMLGSVVRF